ncbi:MAG: hypothetical protein Q9224_006062 [Gallowayella concinna]
MATQAKHIGESKVIIAPAEVESAKLMRQAADILASAPASAMVLATKVHRKDHAVKNILAKMAIVIFCRDNWIKNTSAKMAIVTFRRDNWIKNTSAKMAIIVDAIALVYTAVIISDKLVSPPFGHRHLRQRQLDQQHVS